MGDTYCMYKFEYSKRKHYLVRFYCCEFVNLDISLQNVDYNDSIMLFGVTDLHIDHVMR